jgi:hypothetical protein
VRALVGCDAAARVEAFAHPVGPLARVDLAVGVEGDELEQQVEARLVAEAL